MRKFILTLALLLLVPFAASAQETASEEADKGFLTEKLQDVLSSAGRRVVIDGFRGALSSRATIERIQIEDDEGIWLTVEGIVLDWNRSALLRGRLDVTEFSAERVLMPRLPLTDDAPAPEATPFRIPELPVSVDIAELAIERAEFGAPVLGQDAVMSLAGEAHLDGGGIDVDVALERLDGKTGEISLEARYDPVSKEAAIDLVMQEGAGGIAADKLSIPGAPALDVSLQGAGQISDLTTRLMVTSDGEERLGGTIALAVGEGEEAPFEVEVDLAGDVTPLFAPDLRDFFGQNVSLKARVSRDEAGELSLSGLSLGARTATVEGDFEFSPSGWPRRMDLQLALEDPAGAPVTLPFGEGETTVSRATLVLAYDENEGRGFDATATARGVRTTGFVAETLEIEADGNITSGEAEEIGSVAANVTLDASGLAPESTALARAIGQSISGSFVLAYDEGQPLRISGLNIAGSDFGLTGEAAVDGLDTSLQTSLDTRLIAEDLSRFADLAGVDLKGAAGLAIKGNATLLSGAFDLGMQGTTTDLAIGRETVDRLLAGDGRIDVSVRRDEEGITLRRFEARTPTARVAADGTVSSDLSSVNFTAELPSLSPLFPEDDASGKASLSGRVALDGIELTQASLVALLSDENGTVRLPLGGGISLSGGTLDISYGSDEGRWKADAIFRDFVTDGFAASNFALDGAGTLTQSASGAVATAGGSLALSAEGIEADDPDISRAIGQAATLETVFDFTAGGPLTLDELRFASGETTLAGNAALEAPAGQGPIRFDLVLDTPDLSRFAGISGVDLSGAANLAADGVFRPADGSAEVRLDGTARGIGIGNEQLDPLLSGAGRLGAEVSYSPDGDLALKDFSFASEDTTLTGQATFAAPAGRGPIRFDATFESGTLSRFAGLAGVDLAGTASLSAKGVYRPEANSADVRIDGTTQGLSIGVPQVDPLLSGAGRYSADISYAGDGPMRVSDLVLNLDGTEITGTATLAQPLGQAPITYDLALTAPDLGRFSSLAGTSLTGATSATATGLFDPATGALDLALDGSANGLGIGNSTVDRLLAGRTAFSAQVSRASGTEALTINSATIDGTNIDLTATGTQNRLTLDARLANLGLIAPDFSGPASASGTITLDGDTTGVNVTASGPGGTSAQINGTISSGQANLDITGAAPLGLVNPFITPRRLNGQALIDLRLAGPVALDSLSGTIRTSGARAVAPELGISLENINGVVTVVGGSARVEIAASGSQGGRVAALGTIGLSGALSSDITIRLSSFTVRDPQIYDTTVNGAVSLTGPLSGGASITGRLELGPTEIRIPSSGVTAFTDIPEIDHVGAPTPVRVTRDRAGLTGEGGEGSGGSDTSGGGSGGFALDIVISAANQVFVRGRGLDAELGGSLRLTGTTSDIVPIGAFELVRGRLDILSQRFQLTEGTARLTGSFDANLRLVATTEQNGFTISVIIEGSPSDPRISFSSAPPLPEDEILAQLIFGRDLTTLSPLQALELASAIATLAGRGGGGILSKLRDNFGLDDLDVTQTEEGNTAVRAGKYLSDNVYSDVVVESDGTTELNLNLQITPNVTAKGSTSSDGNSGIGIFFERDY